MHNQSVLSNTSLNSNISMESYFKSVEKERRI